MKIDEFRPEYFYVSNVNLPDHFPSLVQYESYDKWMIYRNFKRLDCSDVNEHDYFYIFRHLILIV